MRLCAWLVATLGRLLNADIGTELTDCRNDFLAQLLADLSDEIRRGIPSRIRDHFVLSDLVGNLIDLSLIFRQFITDDLLQLIDGRRRRLHRHAARPIAQVAVVAVDGMLDLVVSGTSQRPRKFFWRSRASALPAYVFGRGRVVISGASSRFRNGTIARDMLCYRGRSGGLSFAGRLSGEGAMSLGAILVIILIIFLLGGFSGRFGGYGYGMGHSGMGLGGVILIVLLILLLLGKL
jgi:hypothetical protein